jgi:hypothetical protein
MNTLYNVRLRRQETGDEHDRLIFARDEATARERAVARARTALGATMAERTYGRFEVLSCVAVSRNLLTFKKPMRGPSS